MEKFPSMISDLLGKIFYKWIIYSH